MFFQLHQQRANQKQDIETTRQNFKAVNLEEKGKIRIQEFINKNPIIRQTLHLQIPTPAKRPPPTN